MINEIPSHLRKYVVEQNYSRYTPIDQAVWRYIMRQLKSYLSTKAHSCYLEGLQKTGISTEKIPDIEEMSRHLSEYGWRAVPVSGFIPPAAFMELQALGFLPIASDIRTLEHLEYTPAPDIVHEAAGHAPILINPDFSAYLRAYAQVARRAILSSRDLAVYEAIRELSDLKEDPRATEREIAQAYEKLEKAKQEIDEPSEAALLSRMNWWTAEYGLIGSMENPKIYGAGLLSSVGESRWCFDDKVKKIPMSVECIEFNYDITEPQPQLFVVREFNDLTRALETMADQMAFRQGGVFGLQRALEAESVNTVQLNSGVQISGRLRQYWVDSTGQDAVYLSFAGPCQLAFEDFELPNQGTTHHPQGYGSPVGFLAGVKKCLSEFTDNEMESLGLVAGEYSTLTYESGVVVKGRLKSTVVRDGRVVVLTFEECSVDLNGEALFRPEWGVYDLAVGSKIPSVFGGPADRRHFGAVEDFVVKHVPVKEASLERKKLNELYATVRGWRESGASLILSEVESVYSELQRNYSQDWLLRLELVELLQKFYPSETLTSKVRSDLEARASGAKGGPIRDGLALVHSL